MSGYEDYDFIFSIVDMWNDYMQKNENVRIFVHERNRCRIKLCASFCSMLVSSRIEGNVTAELSPEKLHIWEEITGVTVKDRLTDNCYCMYEVCPRAFIDEKEDELLNKCVYQDGTPQREIYMALVKQHVGGIMIDFMLTRYFVYRYCSRCYPPSMCLYMHLAFSYLPATETTASEKSKICLETKVCLAIRAIVSQRCKCHFMFG